jgi:hypothetical protein
MFMSTCLTNLIRAETGDGHVMNPGMNIMTRQIHHLRIFQYFAINNTNMTAC